LATIAYNGVNKHRNSEVMNMGRTFLVLIEVENDPVNPVFVVVAKHKYGI